MKEHILQTIILNFSQTLLKELGRLVSRNMQVTTKFDDRFVTITLKIPLSGDIEIS